MIDRTQIPDPILPEHFDTTHIDILGRGPSVDLYVPRQDAFVICCHFPMVKCDAIASTHFGLWGFYPIPYITVREKVQNEPIKVKDWVVLIKRDNKNPDNCPYNAGEIAYLWACTQKPKSIHLWGFDSLFDENNNWGHSKNLVDITKEKFDLFSIYNNRDDSKCLPSSNHTIHKVIKQNLKSHTVLQRGE